MTSSGEGAFLPAAPARWMEVMMCFRHAAFILFRQCGWTLFIVRRSEPNQALIARLSADAHTLCFDWSAFTSKIKSICPFFGSSLLVSPVFIVYLAGCLCVAAFLSPLILFIFSTFYYQQQKRWKKSLSQIRTHMLYIDLFCFTC